jgi:excisionase family DNA binding protein
VNVVQLPNANSSPQEPSLLIRVEEAARLLDLGRTKTYELIATGQLRAVKIGKATRVPRAAVEEFVRSR